MANYVIKDLNPEIQKFISENKIDKNGNGVIEKENGELSNLLSSGKIKEVAYYPSDWPMMGIAGTGLSLLAFGAGGDCLLKYCRTGRAFRMVDMGSALLFGLGAIAS